jgi:hypothetical protein
MAEKTTKELAEATVAAQARAVRLEHFPQEVRDARERVGREMVSYCLNGHCAKNYLTKRGHPLTVCPEYHGPMVVEPASDMKARQD